MANNLNQFVSFVLDLTDYKILFKNLHKQISDLIDCVKGTSNHLASKCLFEFYILINKYQANDNRLNFFQTLKIQIKNSTDLCDKISKEFQNNKQTDYALSRINLDAFYNPNRILNKLLFDMNYNFLKKNQPIDSKISPSVSPDFGKKTSIIREKHFLLEVLDPSVHIQSSSDCLILENLCIVNAYYDLMTNTFKSASNKSIHRLDYAKLTSVDQNEIELGGHYKYLPFINYHTKEGICLFKVKFLQSMQSSLSNTTNKRNVLNSGDETSNSGLQNIPVLNPIYFCIFNVSQDFIFEMEKFFNSN